MADRLSNISSVVPLVEDVPMEAEMRIDVSDMPEHGAIKPQYVEWRSKGATLRIFVFLYNGEERRVSFDTQKGVTIDHLEDPAADAILQSFIPQLNERMFSP